MPLNELQIQTIDFMLEEARKIELSGGPKVQTGQPSRRNYAAMAPGKLSRCIQELEMGSGDAYDRCVNSGCDPAADLNIAREVFKRTMGTIKKSASMQQKVDELRNSKNYQQNRPNVYGQTSW